MSARPSRVMRRLLAAASLIAAGVFDARAESAPVLRIAQEELRCAASEGPEACAASLLAMLRARAEEDFIVARALRATDAEVAEFMAYNDAFERHDRKQRARKLEELDARLAADADSGDREQLERFRAVLVRLAAYEADVDAGTEPRVAVPVEIVRQWIESAKLDAALYARYRGSVGLRPAGPYAHGARATLIAEYLAARNAQFLDPDIARRFQAFLNAAPRVPFEGKAPDFTPFWKRPIPASYMAD